MSVLLLSLLLAMSFATVAVANPNAGGNMSGDAGNGFTLNVVNQSQPSNADGSYMANTDYIMIDLEATGLTDGEEYQVNWRFMSFDGTMEHGMNYTWTESSGDGFEIIYANWMPMDSGCYALAAELMVENTDTNGTTMLLNEAWTHMMIAVDVDPTNCTSTGPGPGPMPMWQVDVDYDSGRDQIDWMVSNLSDEGSYTLDIWVVNQDTADNSNMSSVWNVIDNMVWSGNAHGNASPEYGWELVNVGDESSISGVEGMSGSIGYTSFGDGCYGVVAVLIDTSSTSGGMHFMVDMDEWTMPAESHNQCNHWHGGHHHGPMEQVWIKNLDWTFQPGETVDLELEFMDLEANKEYAWMLELYWVEKLDHHDSANWDPMAELSQDQRMDDWSQSGILMSDTYYTQVTLVNGNMPSEQLTESCYFVMVKLTDVDGNTLWDTGAHFEVGDWMCHDAPKMPKMDFMVDGLDCDDFHDGHDHGDHDDHNGDHDDHNGDHDDHNGDHGDHEGDMMACAIKPGFGPELTWTSTAIDLPENTTVEYWIGHMEQPVMGEMHSEDAIWNWVGGETNSDDHGTASMTGSVLAGHNVMNALMLYVMWDHDDHHGNNTTGHQAADDGNHDGDHDGTHDGDHHEGDMMVCYDQHNHDVEPIDNKEDCEAAGFMWVHHDQGDDHGQHGDMGEVPPEVMSHLMSMEPWMMDMIMFCSGPICHMMGENGEDEIENVLMSNMGPVKAEVWFEQWTDSADGGEATLNAHMVQHMSTNLRTFVDGTLGNSDGQVDFHEAEMFAMMFGNGDSHNTMHDVTEDECMEMNGDYHVGEEGDEEPHCHYQDTNLDDNESWVFDGVDLGAPDYQFEWIDMYTLMGPVPGDGEAAEYSIVWDQGLGWNLDGLSDWADTETHTLVFTDTDGFIDPCGEDLGAYGEVIVADSTTWSIKSATGNNGWTFNINEGGDAKASFSCLLTPEPVTEFSIVFEKNAQDRPPSSIDYSTYDMVNESADEIEDLPPVCDLFWVENSGNETAPNYESDTKFEESPNGDYEVELADGASYFIHMNCKDPEGDMIVSTWSVGGISMDSFTSPSGEDGTWGWVEFTVPEGVGGTVSIDYAWESGNHTGGGTVTVTATGDGSGGDLTETIVESAGEGALPGFTTAITAVAALVGALVIARRD